jgi:hypothetical protein
MNTPIPQEIFLKEAHGDVGQDKSATLIDRTASTQPQRPPDEVRLNHNGVRSNYSRLFSKEPLVPLTTQVRRSTKAEIERLAKQGDGKEKMSVSAVAAEFLERGVQGDIDMQYGAMLRPVIEQAIKKEIERHINRVINLLIKVFYAAEQGRILNIQILPFILEAIDDTDELPLIISNSEKQAWDNLKRHIGDDKQQL